MPHVFRYKHQHTGTDIDMNRPVDFHIRWAASTERASAVRVVVERVMHTLQLISSFNFQSVVNRTSVIAAEFRGLHADPKFRLTR